MKRDSKGGHRHPAFPSLYAVIYMMLAKEAREHGYALALHGSLGRDLDVVAIPWTEDAIPAEEMVEHMRARIDGWIVDDPQASEKNPVEKPHGRLGWAIHLVGTGGYVDLSVMPRGAP